MFAPIALVLASTAAAVAFSPPTVLVAHVSELKQIDRLSGLPAPIVAGDFTIDGVSAKGWRMSDPGGPFNATDVASPGDSAPGRRLLFAACDRSLCAMVYERGGIAHFYEILISEKYGSAWNAIWNARGPKPLANLAALRALVSKPAAAHGWSDQWVKGDF